MDETGKVLNTAVIYPTPPQNKTVESAKTVRDLIRRYNIDIISIGNGTASREAEIFIADLIKEMDREIFYMVVSESAHRFIQRRNLPRKSSRNTMSL